MEVNLEEFIAVKGIKALGNQLTGDKIKTVNLLESLPYDAPVIEDVEVKDEEIIDDKDPGQQAKFGSSQKKIP